MGVIVLRFGPLRTAMCCAALALVTQGAPGRQGRDPLQHESGKIQVVERGVVRGPAGARRLALVFTGHEFAEGADTILDVLARRHQQASFFLTGAFLRDPHKAPLVRRMLRDGHYVGPHSDGHLLYSPWTGPKVTLVSHEVFASDHRVLSLIAIPPPPVSSVVSRFEPRDATVFPV